MITAPIRLSVRSALYSALIVAMAIAGTADAGEIVHFRLVRARTIELSDQATANSYSRTLTQLGCEQRLDGHEGHFHLTMRCPTWRQTEFADHDMAHKWEAWLQSLGFEVRHDHR